MVNAILRRAQREGFPVVSDDAGWPPWLRKQLRADWGDRAEAIFTASAQMAPMWLRMQRSRVDPPTYVARLAELGMAAHTDAVLPDAVRLASALPVSQLPGFAEGDVSVQDGSAQQVADALMLAPLARVLDACAAPGGKAAHLLERHSGLQLTALDVDARRLERMQQTLQRTVPNARVALHAADATDTAAWWDGQPFDTVLLDAPCSATGVVRRQPDVLLHRRADDIDALCLLQARLLDATWRTLRPGGQLLYTTCSLLARENQVQVDAFLQRTPDAQTLPLGAQFGHAVGPGRQRFPGEQHCDGFFYAALLKAY